MKENENLVFEDLRTKHLIDVACYSGIGARESQQDAAYVYVGDEIAFGVVCDGMGGARGGELASTTAVHFIRERFLSSLESHTDFVDEGVQMLEAVDDIIYGLKDRNGSTGHTGSRHW